MRVNETLRETKKTIIKKCHVCGHLNESKDEPKKCSGCNKSFLPLNYFSKVHKPGTEQYDHLFSSCDELCHEDLIKGIYVIW